MKVAEMDAMCKDIDVETMCISIGLDIDDLVERSWLLAGQIPDSTVANFIRIGALIGYLYAKKTVTA